MKITLEYLIEIDACEEGLKFVSNNNLIDLEHIDFLNALIEFNSIDTFKYAIWLMTRLNSRIDNIKLTVFAAGKVEPIYENEYPNDMRIKNAIQATKKVIENDSEENRNAAYAAYSDAYAAYAAANTAYAAYAAYAAAYAAYAAANAAYAAYAAANADCAAAYAAVKSTDAVAAYSAAESTDAKIELLNTITEYGMELIKQNKEL